MGAENPLGSPKSVVPPADRRQSPPTIGNRRSTTRGGDENIPPTPSSLYDSEYLADLLNQYAQRQVSGNIEVTGRTAGTSSTVLVNGVSSRLGTSGAPMPFYHRQLSFDNTQSPAIGAVNIQEVPGDQTNYQVFLPRTPETFTHDADGNLTLDGVWSYEWDAENRLKAMWMRPDVANARLGIGDWVRLEFAYDYATKRARRIELPTFSLGS